MRQSPKPTSNPPIVLDCRGLPSPQPLVKLGSILRSLAGRNVCVEIKADHWGFADDLNLWCQKNGVRILRSAATSGECYALVESGSRPTRPTPNVPVPAFKEGQPTVNMKIPSGVRAQIMAVGTKTERTG